MSGNTEKKVGVNEYICACGSREYTMAEYYCVNFYATIHDHNFPSISMTELNFDEDTDWVCTNCGKGATPATKAFLDAQGRG